MPTFDLEYFFINLRAKSIGESVELRMRHRTGYNDDGAECDHVTLVDVNLLEIEEQKINEYLESDIEHKTLSYFLSSNNLNKKQEEIVIIQIVEFLVNIKQLNGIEYFEYLYHMNKYLKIYQFKIFSLDEKIDNKFLVYEYLQSVFNNYETQINKGYSCNFKDGAISWFDGSDSHTLEAGIGSRMSIAIKLLFFSKDENNPIPIRQRETEFFSKRDFSNIEERERKIRDYESLLPFKDYSKSRLPVSGIHYDDDYGHLSNIEERERKIKDFQSFFHFKG
jgi:hypothetical protein